MLRDDDSPERREAKLLRINQALMRRLERMDEGRGSSHALSQAAALLEREVLARNLDLERTLADLGQMNAELAQARAAAEEASRAKSRFLRAASHDLLQPLSAAKLLLGHLQDSLHGRPEAETIAHVIGSFDSAEELIRMLLEIARLDSRRLILQVGPVALGRLFQRLAVDMQGLVAARGLGLIFVPSALTVESDPVFLRSIAQNLVSNALKYTETGRVLVGVRRAGAHVWLEVHDTGPGIAPADQARIFQEFERLAPSDQPGSGLGLSIVRRACDQLGHAIDLRSQPGRGSCFRVRLPVANPLAKGAFGAQPPRFAPAKAAPSGLGGSGLGGTLRAADGAPDPLVDRCALVVENDPGMRHAFCLLLQSWGMTVLPADGLETLRGALRGAQQHRPAVVLTDFRLDRGETGVQVITTARRLLQAPVPALIVSAESAEAIRGCSAHLGAQVLQKPINEAALRRALCALMAGGGLAA